MLARCTLRIKTTKNERDADREQHQQGLSVLLQPFFWLPASFKIQFYWIESGMLIELFVSSSKTFLRSGVFFSGPSRQRFRVWREQVLF